MHDFLRQHWHALWYNAHHDEHFDDIMVRYDEPQRHYHTTTHLYECFGWFDKVKDKLHRPKQVALALFYHDVIYNPKSTSNEEDSAHFANDALMGLVRDDELATIHRYIITTKDHINPSTDGDLDYLLDMDLAILGADIGRFNEYNTQIRQEFAWIDEALYHDKRRQVLLNFYQKSPLFITPYFADKLQMRAKQNLRHALGL